MPYTMTALMSGIIHSHVQIEKINQKVLVIQVNGCKILKLTNSRNSTSNTNCMATLHATAHKHRIVQIFLHSISTLFTAVGAFAAGISDDGVDAGIELFKTFAMAP